MGGKQLSEKIVAIYTIYVDIYVYVCVYIYIYIYVQGIGGET